MRWSEALSLQTDSASTLLRIFQQLGKAHSFRFKQQLKELTEKIITRCGSRLHQEKATRLYYSNSFGALRLWLTAVSSATRQQTAADFAVQIFRDVSKERGALSMCLFLDPRELKTSDSALERYNFSKQKDSFQSSHIKKWERSQKQHIREVMDWFHFPLLRIRRGDSLVFISRSPSDAEGSFLPLTEIAAEPSLNLNGQIS